MADVDEAAAAEAPEAAPAPEADPFDSPDTTTFDRSYVERLRKENASYRTRAKELEESSKPFMEAFTGIADTDRDVVLDFARTLAADPMRAAEMAKGFVEALTPAEQREVAAQVAADSQQTDTPITKADVLAILQEQQRAAEVERAQQQIDREATDLGFPPGSRDYVALLYEAHTNQGDNLTKAAEVIKAERDEQRQHAIDEYLASKQGAAAGAGTPSPAGAAAGHIPTQPKTIEEAAKAAHERLRASLNQ